MGAPMAGNGRGTGRRYEPLSQINVTPMVDVMLVLLIVFMITAPLLTVGVPVDLPKSEAAQLSDQVEPLVVSVNSEGKVYLQETEIALESLPERLRAVTATKPDTIIYVRGDQAIDYGRVMAVMGALSAGGFTRVSLIAEFPDPSAAAPRG